MQGGLKGCDSAEEELVDRWIKSRLNAAIDKVHAETGRFRLDDALSAIYRFTWNEYCDWYLELIKPRLYGKLPEEREMALATALEVFKSIIKLLHPYMPFITEELNEALFSGPEGNGMLIKSQYPEYRAELCAPEAEKEMSFIQEVIGSVRTLRSEMNVPPMKMGELVLIGQGRQIDLLERYVSYLTTLAKVDRILRAEEKPRPAVSAIVEGVELFLPLGDLIDVDAERKRLEKERDRLDGRLNGLSKKLQNPNFLQKAAPDVVSREREKLANVEAELAKINSNIDLLS